MNNPLVSVIVPVYGVEKYLDRCIRSIVDQTYSNLEIILVDDGSPDNCPQICDSWAEKDCRIKVIHKENGGSSSARNAGLDVFRGQFVSFIDGDDWIELEYYSEMIDLMIQHNAEIGCVGRYDISEKTGYKHRGLCPAKRTVLSSTEMLGQMLTWDGCDFSPCDKIYIATIWKNIRFPLGKTTEDIGVLYKIIDCANQILLYPKPMYNYYHREGSITRENFSSLNSDIVYFSDEICQFISSKYPQLLTEAKYFKLKALLYWIRSFFIKNEPSCFESTLYRSSQTWLAKNYRFVLFSCKYVSWKDKIWYLLIVLKMRGIVCRLLKRHAH